jgi:hypothetical protein
MRRLIPGFDTLKERANSKRSASKPLAAGIAVALAWAASFPAVAWHDTGHMVVAELAHRALHPKAREAVDRLSLVGATPATTGFVMGSCWADDVKNPKDAPWHYINLHFRDDKKKPANQPAKENVVWAIRKMIAILEDPSTAEMDRADALRYLTHLVGDIHSPMHCVARDSAAFPKGDRGGNDFALTPPEGLKPAPRNLHFLWDMGGGVFKQISRPLTPGGRGKVLDLADAISRLHPPSRLKKQLRELNPQKWAEEGFALAKTKAYKIKEGSAPDAAYLKVCRESSMERVALAGYRLAAVLNRVWPE